MQIKQLLLITALLLAGCNPDAPVNADEILNAIRACEDRGLKPVVFRDGFYNSIRKIECGKTQRTIWY